MESYYSFPSIYNTKDHQQLACQSIVAYFNELGEKLINARNTGIKLNLITADPYRAYNMRQIGCASTLLDAHFTCGTEHRNSQTLFNINKGERCNYHWYFDNIYRILCEEIEGGRVYVNHDDSILLMAATIHKKRTFANVADA